jgi:hypothetical protein
VKEPLKNSRKLNEEKQRQEVVEALLVVNGRMEGRERRRGYSLICKGESLGE